MRSAYFGHAELFEPVWQHSEFILPAAKLKGDFLADAHVF
jgi:hypothetical protein